MFTDLAEVSVTPAHLLEGQVLPATHPTRDVQGVLGVVVGPGVPRVQRHYPGRAAVLTLHFPWLRLDSWSLGTISVGYLQTFNESRNSDFNLQFLTSTTKYL